MSWRRFRLFLFGILLSSPALHADLCSGKLTPFKDFPGALIRHLNNGGDANQILQQFPNLAGVLRLEDFERTLRILSRQPFAIRGEVADSFYQKAFEKLAVKEDAITILHLAFIVRVMGMHAELGGQWLGRILVPQINQLSGPQADQITALLGWRDDAHASFLARRRVNELRAKITSEYTARPAIRKEVDRMAIAIERLGLSARGSPYAQRLRVFADILQFLDASGEITGSEFVRLSGVVFTSLNAGLAGSPSRPMRGSLSHLPTDKFYEHALARLASLSEEDYEAFIQTPGLRASPRNLLVMDVLKGRISSR
jgi:hypothetical protein